MKRLLTLTGISVVFLTSCQKEINGDFNNGNSTSGLLMKIGSKTDADTSTTTFGYNASQKLVNITIDETTGGQTQNSNQTIVRNSQGVVTSIITKSPGLAQYGLDSLKTVVHTDASGKYTSRVTTIDLIILIIRDSVALQYAGNNIAKEIEYLDDGTGYAEFGRSEYTYSGNNISSVKVTAADDNGVLQPYYVINYTYDSKVSPLIMGNEATAIGYSNYFSSNNITKVELNMIADPTQNATITTTYTYNPANKPLTAILVEQGGTSTKDTYTYQ